LKDFPDDFLVKVDLVGAILPATYKSSNVDYKSESKQLVATFLDKKSEDD
jgi:hypothetical protein